LNTHASSKQPVLIFALAIAILLLHALPAFAQGSSPQEKPRWGKERIETVIIGKFASELDLTPGQAEQFFPRFRQFQNQMEELQRQQAKRQRDLEELSRNPETNRDQVNQLLMQQSQDEEQMTASKRQFLSDVSGFLSPQQVSRCSILMNDLRTHVQKFMDDRRNSRGSGHSKQDKTRRKGF